MRNSRGYTLLELLIVTVTFSLAFVATIIIVVLREVL
jgi:type II secretory pathway pseudopilin PulG